MSAFFEVADYYQSSRKQRWLLRHFLPGITGADNVSPVVIEDYIVFFYLDEL